MQVFKVKEREECLSNERKGSGALWVQNSSTAMRADWPLNRMRENEDG